MRTPFIVASMSLGLIIVAVGATASPRASAADAGEAIETVQSHCTSGPASVPPRATWGTWDCVAIFRNRADRPVYDIEVDMHIGGQFAGTAFGNRTSLGAGESALLQTTRALSDNDARDAPVTFTYRASWTGDEGALAVPRPQLQYVDRLDLDDHVVFVGEVRNVDGRRWRALDDDEGEWRVPRIALFRRGKLIGGGYVGLREPSGRIGLDGRYVFVADEVDQGIAREADRVEVFYVDRFDPDGARFSAANWQLTGLDHRIETDARGEQQMVFTVSMRNPAASWSHGAVGVFARRADFHVIGYGDCGGVKSLPAGGEATCSGEVDLIRPNASLDDTRFVTVEIGGAVAALPTPTPTVTATPCPAHATPAPVPTLSVVAGRLWFPWSIRTMTEQCP